MAFLEAQTDIAKEAYMSTINALGTSNLNAYKSHSWTGGSNPRLENLKTQASEHGLSESVLDTQRLILSSVPDKDKKAVLEQMQQGANKILAFGSGVSQLPASLGGSVVNKALGTAEGISETAGYKEAVTAFNRIGDTLERVSKPYLNAAGEFDKGIKVDIEVKAAPGTAAVILGSRTNK
jgi:hypothetical protein